MRRYLGLARSSDALKVGPHHVGDAADLGETPDVIDGGLLRARASFSASSATSRPILFRCLKQSATVLATLYTRSLTPSRSSFLNACGIGIACELHHLDRRIVDTGGVAAPRHGDPDLARQLGGQFMELQCREQAKHRLRHFGGDGPKAFELRAPVRPGRRYRPRPTFSSRPAAVRRVRTTRGAPMASRSLARSSPFWLARSRTR